MITQEKELVNMENERSRKNYDIGLDIGDTSVGWAVTGDDFGVIKLKRKRLIGVRLFDIGKTAATRRTKRIARRRLERRRERTELLRELMAPDINAADPSFYERMDSSVIRPGDEMFRRQSNFNLFDGKGMSERKFYRENPTIYHLRQRLVHDETKYDIRAVYLALHHMIKYRGNFLYEGDGAEIKGYEAGGIRRYFEKAMEIADIVIGQVSDQAYTEAEGLLLDKTKTRNDRRKKASELFPKARKGDFGADLSKAADEIFKALLGMKFDLYKACFYERETDDESCEAVKISFSDDDYDEKESEYIDSLGENAPLLGELKKIYYGFEFKEIMGEEEYLSDAMVKRFDEHHEDKLLLKRLFQRYPETSEDGKRFFSSNPAAVTKQNENKDQEAQEQESEQPKGKKDKPKVDAVCYEYYIRKPKKIEEQIKNKTAYESIKNKIFEILKKVDPSVLEADEDYVRLKEQSEIRDIMPKLNSKRNGAIPYQLHLKEMRRILENQGKYYPSLRENAEKIMKILSFRRPYFVGVIGNKTHSVNKWYDQEVVGKAYPWNFEEVVKYDRAEEKFIEKLVGKCTYFPGEKVLPAESFLYSEYKVLNELNRIKVDGKNIDPKLKNEIFRDLFMARDAKAKVTAKDLAEYLKDHGFRNDLSATDITGLTASKGTAFANIYKPYRDFSALLGDKFRDADIPLYDKVVYELTVFSDAKTREKRIKNILNNGAYTENDIKRISKLNYSGWGRFSRMALDTVTGAINGEPKTVIEVMRETTLGMMQIIWDEKYGFKDKFIRQKETKTLSPAEIYEDIIRPAYCSPAVKKGIYEAVKLIDEIVKIMGAKPRRIYVETTHNTDKKKKGKFTDTRVNDLKKALESVEKDTENNIIGKSELDEIKEELRKYSDKIDNEKVYLWFRQLGRCLYTGEPIEFENIPHCEVDHILPRSLIKDDSLENKALVKRIENQNKGDQKVLPEAVRKKMKPFWSLLHRSGLMGKKKFENLSRQTFSEEDVSGFIHRQLVETQQITKEVEKILEQAYGDPSLEAREKTVRRVKARLSDEFKKAIGYYKVRDLNDLHHAKDAYAAAVLGRFTELTVQRNIGESREKFARWRASVSEEDAAKYREDTWHGIVVDMMLLKFLANTDVEGTPDGETKVHRRLVEYGEILWDDETLGRVKRHIFRNDILLTKKIEKIAEAEFYDQTMYSSKSEKKLRIPLRYIADKDGIKRPLPLKDYGGYSGENDAYAVLAVYKKQKVEDYVVEKKIIGIPTRIAVYNDESIIEKYVDAVIKETEHGEKMQIVRKIYKNQLIRYKGQLFYFVSETELNNAEQIGDETIMWDVSVKTGEYPGWQRSLAVAMSAFLNGKNLDKEKISQIMGGLKRFIYYFSENLEKRCPLFARIAQGIRFFIDVGAFDKLATEQNKLSFIKDIMGVSAKSGGSPKLSKITAEVCGKTVAVKGNGGRYQRQSLNAEHMEFVDRSVTGFWEQKSKV